MSDMDARKEMVLRMIIRYNKVRKHKPKKVEKPVLKVGSSETSTIFVESEVKTKEYYSRKQTQEIRENLQALLEKL